MYADILNKILIPFMAKNFNYKNFKLHQDNDPKHTSKVCIDTLNNLGIKWVFLSKAHNIFYFKFSFKLRSPPSSPDLNPIEWVWADLKRYVKKSFCRSEEEIMKKVFEFQYQLSETKCRAYIDKLKEVNKQIK